MDKGKLPADFKTAKVTPIHKDGPKDDPSNYRPTSVLSNVMKLFEGIVHNQTYEYIDQNNLLNVQQSGFRPKHSTLTTLVDVNEYLLTNMDNSRLTGAIFLNLKKAFDTVSQPVLCQKFRKLGIDGKELDWFAEYIRVIVLKSYTKGHSVRY